MRIRTSLRVGDVVAIGSADARRRFVVEDSGQAGGMGIVYAVREVFGERRGPRLALKTINPAGVRQFARESQVFDFLVQSLRREGEVLDRIAEAYGNPHTVHIVALAGRGDIVEPSHHAGFPAILLEFCPFALDDVFDRPHDADSESEIADAQRLLKTLAGVRDVLRGVVCALKAVADLPGVEGARGSLIGTFRDLKPGNILFHNGRVLLSDFGTYKAQDGRTLSLSAFSAFYAAPEVRREFHRHAAHRHEPGFTGRALDYAAADVYGFGLIAFECLVGRRPLCQSAEPSPVPGDGRSVRRGTALFEKDQQDLIEAVGRLEEEIGAGRRTLMAGVDVPDWARMRRELPDLVCACLDADPDSRPPIGAIHARIAGWRAGAPALRDDVPSPVQERKASPGASFDRPAAPIAVRRTARRRRWPLQLAGATLIAGALATTAAPAVLPAPSLAFVPLSPRSPRGARPLGGRADRSGAALVPGTRRPGRLAARSRPGVRRAFRSRKLAVDCRTRGGSARRKRKSRTGSPCWQRRLHGQGDPQGQRLGLHPAGHGRRTAHAGRARPPLRSLE